MKLYNYTLDFNDGSADGCHQKGGGTEKEIELIVTRKAGSCYFAEEPDGRILIYRSEAESAKESNAIGTVTTPA
jgi:hypothetical protein